MSHIFISYSHKDKKYVEKLERKLIEEGFNVWIDHRIDYGSQWTAEIENAIDTCDAYIVVMSEDAKKSPWVQREVIHAERRKKPFFPLLLNGEFWFSLGDIQFVDVSNGSIPPDDYFEKIEEFVKRIGNYDSKNFIHLTQYWDTYHNSRYNFSLNYPPEFEKVIDKPNEARFNFPEVPGTNLHSKFIKIEIREVENCTNLITTNFPAELIEKRNIRIGDMLFIREIWNDAGMSKYNQMISYSTSREKICVSITIVTRVTSDGPYFPRLIPKVDVEADKEIILYVASTFRWREK